MPKRKRSRGAPTKFTPDRCAKIIAYIRSGSFKETAVRASGIHYTTFRDWMNKGEEDIGAGEDTAHANFYHDVTRAEAEGELAIALPWVRVAKQGGRRTSTSYEFIYDKNGDPIVDLATGEHKRKVIKVIEEKVDDWRSAMEYLSRRFPGWEKKIKQDIVDCAAEATIPLDALSPKLRKAIEKELTAYAKGESK